MAVDSKMYVLKFTIPDYGKWQRDFLRKAAYVIPHPAVAQQCVQKEVEACCESKGVRQDGAQLVHLPLDWTAAWVQFST